MGRQPEAWIAPAEVRELRELTRYRCRLVGLRTSCRNQVHGVLGKLGILVTCSDVFGAAGSAWLDQLHLPQPYAGKVTSLRQLAGELTTEITMVSEVIAGLLAGHRGYQVIQQLPGIGPVLAAVIVAEIGEVTRFRNAAQLCSWAGLTPRHREPRHQNHPRACHQARLAAAALGTDRGHPAHPGRQLAR
jgi:transposase